ncbi:MAG: hypothetical protein WC082_15035 [Victivallales bacterium]
MKRGILLILSITLSGAVTALSAPENKDEITLPDGRVLEKPYIISRNPAGLNVGYKNGVIFVPFSEMSEEKQKYYKYDPEKAKEYNQKLAAARQQRQAKLKQKKMQAQQQENDDGFSYIPDSSPEQSILGRLENEMVELRKENARLKKEYSDVRAGRISPVDAGDPYMSYRGGKVYRKGRSQSAGSAEMQKRRRLKELKGAIQRNERRIVTVRNLISREKTTGIQKGKRL